MVRAEIGGEFWREQFGEDAGIGDAKLFGAEKIEQIVFVHAVGSVVLADGGQRLGQGGVEGITGRMRISLGFPRDTNLTAEAGELGARGVDGGKRYGGYGGQNSSR